VRLSIELIRPFRKISRTVDKIIMVCPSLLISLKRSRALS